MVLNSGDAFTDDPPERLRLVKQDVVVDIQPTSRHGGESDLAHVRSTVVTERGRVITTSQTLPVFEVDEHFSLMVSVPPAFAEPMEAGREFTVVFLLPRDGDEYTVELREHVADHDPQVFDGTDLPRLGGRIAVVWRGNGTDLGGVWQYIPIPR
jgi:hypothetical protein